MTEGGGVLWESLEPSNYTGLGRNPFGDCLGEHSESAPVPLTIGPGRRQGFVSQCSYSVPRSLAVIDNSVSYRCPTAEISMSHQRDDQTLSYPSGTGLDCSSLA